MKIRRIAVSLIALAMLIVYACTPAFAGVVSPGDDFYYLDEANVLDTDTEGEIFFSNQLLEEACGAQVVVVALETTGSVAIDDYAYDLFNEWGIGDKDENNGFLLLMAIEDEDYYAVAGTGLDLKFSSGTIGSYLDRYLEPDFAEGDYDEGARLFFEAAFKRISDAYNADVTVEDGIAAYKAYMQEDTSSNRTSTQTAPGTVTRREERSGGFGLGLIIVILIVVLIIVSRRKRRVYRAPVNNHRGSSFFVPFMLGRMSNKPRTTYIPPRTPPHNPGRNSFHIGGFGSGNMFGGANNGGGRTGGFGSGRPGGFSSGRSSGFGSSGRSSFGGSGRSGFGGARGGGGGSRGGGAGRGRR